MLVGIFMENIWPKTIARRAPQARQAVHIQSNTEGRSCNHSCSGKAISITYSEWVFVALGIGHAMRERHIVICGLSGSAVFSHII